MINREVRRETQNSRNNGFMTYRLKPLAVASGNDMFVLSGFKNINPIQTSAYTVEQKDSAHIEKMVEDQSFLSLNKKM
jgi:hypothetical protein